MDDAASIQSGRSLASVDTRSIQSVRSPRSPTEYKFHRASAPRSPSQSPKRTAAGISVNITEDRRSIQSLHSDGAEPNGISGSLSQSPQSPHTPRPSKLSVSQTTLRESECLVSEPATPKASDTPDTVRIFVSYSISNSGDPVRTRNSVESPSFDRSSSASQNGEIKVVACSSTDPNKIKIKVDGDTSFCSESSSSFENVTSKQLDFNADSSFNSTFCSSQSPDRVGKPIVPITLDSPEYRDGLL